MSLVSPSLAVITIAIRSLLERKGFIWTMCLDYSPQEPKQSRSLEAGTEANTTGGSLFTNLFPMAHSTCFLIPSRPVLRMAPLTLGRGLPHQSLIKKNTPIDLPTSRPNGGTISTEAPASSSMYQVDKNKSKVTTHSMSLHLKESRLRGCVQRAVISYDPAHLTVLGCYRTDTPDGDAMGQTWVVLIHEHFSGFSL